MSIKPKCNICKKELVEFGAILLSPPKKDIVRKFHICVVCYEKQVKKLGYLSFVGVEGEQAEVDKFCNNDVCEIPLMSETI